MKQTKRTFNEILQQVESANADKLMSKAVLANKIAKNVKGKTQTIVYEIKTKCACEMLKKTPNFANIINDSRFVMRNFVVIKHKTSKKSLHIPKNRIGGNH